MNDINNKKKCTSELRLNDLNLIFLYTAFTGSTYMQDRVVVNMRGGGVEGKP